MRISKYRNCFYVILFIQNLYCFAGDNGRKPWISLSSGLTVSGQYYRNWGGDPRQQPFMYSISGSPALDIKGMTMPFNVLYSNQIFTYQQPFNQIGFTPRFKWGTIYLGSTTMRLSNYSLAGQRFTGVGADLQLGWFRIGGMYGRLRRQVLPLGLSNDPLTFLNEREASAFERRGYAVKLGFGKKEQFFDFIFFKANDILPEGYVKEDWFIPGFGSDTTKTFVMPKENAVFAINSSFKIAKKIQLRNDWAISAFTRDLNADSVYIADEKARQWAERILLPRFSTTVRIAGESSIRYLHKYASPSFTYKRIEHEYTSLGAYFFQTDIEQYAAGLTLNLFKSRLTLSGNFGQQRDNLQGLRLRTSTRNISSLAGNFNPSPNWGASFNYSNYGLTQSPLPKTLTDTTRINQVNNALSLVPRYSFKGKNLAHNFTLVLGYNAMSNLGASLGASAEITSYNTSLNYTLTHLPSNFSAGLAPTRILSQTQAGEIVSNGASAQASRNFAKGKIQTNYAYGFFGNSFNGLSNGNTQTHTLGFAIQPNKWPSASVNLQYINNSSLNDAAGASFKELYINLTVSYTFKK
ncbi:MAG: hypothetical protein ACK5B6_01120 [Bacteroidia bacterium]|jgi:hypothetical protein